MPMVSLLLSELEPYWRTLKERDMFKGPVFPHHDLPPRNVINS